MRTKDILTITMVALGTATLTVTIFIASPLEAGNEPKSAAANIATPTLTLEGVEMTLTPLDSQPFIAGSQPSFELRATNTLDKPATVPVTVALSASAPRNFLARVVSAPSILWHDDPVLTLEPHQTRRIALHTLTNLPVNKNFNVTLARPEDLQIYPLWSANAPAPAPSTIVALSFSTAPNPPSTPMRLAAKLQ